MSSLPAAKVFIEFSKFYKGFKASRLSNKKFTCLVFKKMSFNHGMTLMASKSGVTSLLSWIDDLKILSGKRTHGNLDRRPRRQQHGGAHSAGKSIPFISEQKV